MNELPEKLIIGPAENTYLNETGEDCLINYVWINKERDKKNRTSECSVSLKHLDGAYRNARLYPDARCNVWIDFRFLDKRSRGCLKEHFEASAPPNAMIRDLNDIPQYKAETLFQPASDSYIWARVDLARLIVLNHEIEHRSETYEIYADFDVRDVRLAEAKNKMNIYSLALGTTGPEELVDKASPESKDSIENGYFAFKKNRQGMKYLKNILSKTFKEAVGRKMNGFSTFMTCTEKWAEKEHVSWAGEFAVHNILYRRGYKIPENPLYRELNWNL